MRPRARQGGGVQPQAFFIEPISDGEFELFQALIYREAGIHLGPAKRGLLVGRLSRRLRELRINTFGAYYRRLMSGDEEENVRMLDCICTSETHFFRQPQHFEFLEQVVFPAWRAKAAAGTRSRRIRIWSAACATGEEPYSLAMCLWRYFPPSEGWQLEILGTDLSTRVLERAKNAVWPLAKAHEIPEHYLREFMLRGVDVETGRMRGGAEIRSIVRFQRLNLNDASYPRLGVFDLIFCRNVLIYFGHEAKVSAIERIMGHLDRDGHIFLGHAESLTGMPHHLRTVVPTIYAHARTPGSWDPVARRARATSVARQEGQR